MKILAAILAMLTLAACGSLSDNLLPNENINRFGLYQDGFYLGSDPATGMLKLGMGTNLAIYESVPVFAADANGDPVQLGFEIYELDPETGAATLRRRDAFGTCSDFTGLTSAGREGGAIDTGQGQGTGPGIVSCRQWLDDPAEPDEPAS